MNKKISKVNKILICTICAVVFLLLAVFLPNYVINSKNAKSESVVNAINKENTFVLQHVVIPKENDNKIEDSFLINFNTSSFENKGITLAQAKQVFVEDFEKRFVEPVNVFLKNVNESAKLSEQEKNIIKSGIKAEVKQSETSVTAKISFESSYVLNLYVHGLDYVPSDKDNTEQKQNVKNSVFLKTYYLNIANSFVGTDGNLAPYYEKVKNFFVENSLGHPNFIQVLGNSFTQYFSNANHVETVNGMKYHFWNVDVANLSQEFILYKQYQNAISWYLLAMGVTIVLVCGMIIVSNIVKQKQNINKNVN